MKKTYLALAALAATGAASAQSSLTLFGVVDAGLSYYSTKSSFFNLPTSASGSTSARQSQWVVSSSGFNTSRLGLRGTEDLGGGLAAGFWLESPLANDSGVGNLSFTRRSTLSLTGSLGELRLGRDYTATFYADGVFDPLGVSGVGTNVIAVVNSNLAIARGLATGGLLGGGASLGTDNYLRTSNAISYFLPPNLGGFYGQLQYAFHENVDTGNVAGSPSQRGRYAGGRFGWTQGALDMALAYGESTVASTATSREDIKTLNLGASYDFGPAKAYGELSQVRDQSKGVVAQRMDDRYDGAVVGVTVPIGPSLIRASYGRVNFKNGTNPINGDASVNKLALGYVYNLSKRTALYATVARISIKDGHNNPGVMGVTPQVLSNPAIIPQPGYVSNATSQPGSAMGYDIGVRLAF